MPSYLGQQIKCQSKISSIHLEDMEAISISSLSIRSGIKFNQGAHHSFWLKSSFKFAINHFCNKFWPKPMLLFFANKCYQIWWGLWVWYTVLFFFVFTVILSVDVVVLLNPLCKEQSPLLCWWNWQGNL